LGKFLQVDPMADKYASATTYNYAFNNPVVMNDPMGDDPKDPWRPKDPWKPKQDYQPGVSPISDAQAAMDRAGAMFDLVNGVNSPVWNSGTYGSAAGSGGRWGGGWGGVGKWIPLWKDWYNKDTGELLSSEIIGWRYEETDPDYPTFWGQLKEGWYQHVIKPIVDAVSVRNVKFPQVVINGPRGPNHNPQQYALRRTENGDVVVFDLNDKNNIIAILNFRLSDQAGGKLLAGHGIYEDDPRNLWYGHAFDRVYHFTEMIGMPGYYWVSNLDGYDGDYLYFYVYDQQNKLHVMKKTEIKFSEGFDNFNRNKK
jgi:hypothetical protein